MKKNLTQVGRYMKSCQNHHEVSVYIGYKVYNPNMRDNMCWWCTEKGNLHTFLVEMSIGIAVTETSMAVHQKN